MINFFDKFNSLDIILKTFVKLIQLITSSEPSNLKFYFPHGTRILYIFIFIISHGYASANVMVSLWQFALDMLH